MKKLLLLILSILLIFPVLSNVTVSAEGASIILADLDSDGKIGTSDFAMMKLFLSGANELDSVEKTKSDLDGDGDINTVDLATMKLLLAGAIKYDDLKNIILDSGKCGDNLNWELLSSGTLYISGTGAMYDYVKYSTPSPWYKYRDEPYISDDGAMILNPDGTEYLSATSYYADNPNGYKIKNIVIDEGITYLGDWAFYRICVDELIIPEGVESTGYFCIRYSPTLKTVILPNSLKVLNDFGISRNQVLTKIDFGDKLEKVGRCGIAQNPKLQSAMLPLSVTSVNEFLHEKYNGTAGNNMGLFDGCIELKEVSLGSVKVIPQRTFLNCQSLENIIIPQTVTSIGEYAFTGCTSLKSVTFENESKCTLIQKAAFMNCSALEKIVGCVALETVEYNAFNGAKKLTEFTFSDANISFPQYMFLSSEIQTAYIGKGMTKIPYGLFSYSNLETIYISSGLTQFEAYAVESCKSLKDIYFEGDREQWNSIIKAETWAKSTPSTVIVHFLDGTTELLVNCK